MFSKRALAAFGVVIALTSTLGLYVSTLPPMSLDRESEARVFSVTPTELELQFSDETENERIEKFVITNLGSSILTIDSVATTCGCALANEFETLHLTHGQQAELKVTFQSPGYNDRAIRINVSSSTPQRHTESTKVMLRARELRTPFIRKFPKETVIAGSRTREKEATIRFRIRSVEDTTSGPWVAGIRAGDENLTATLALVSETSISSGTVWREYECTVKGSPKRLFAESSRYSGICEFDVSSPPTQPLPQIRFEFQQWPEIRVKPETVYISRSLAKGTTVKRAVVLVGEDNDWQVTGVESSSEWVTAALRPVSADQRTKCVDVAIDAAAQVTIQPTAVLTIKTTHPHQSKIEIPVYVGP